MPVFKQGVPVTTTVPRVVVEAPLTPGTYVYELVVEDDLHNLSAPVRTTVTIT